MQELLTNSFLIDCVSLEGYNHAVFLKFTQNPSTGTTMLTTFNYFLEID